jgi:Arc/MetJ-type ribon-helix-helix transcriptional regulator
MPTVKTQIVFPEELLQELDRHVKERQRSDFVVEAVQEKLQRLRLEESLSRAGGLWKDRSDMKTDSQVNKYLKRLRGADTRRQSRMRKAWKNG